MCHEFDDDADDADEVQPAGVKPSASQHARPLAARLVARLYAGADRSQRARMLACLTRPLGPLGLMAVASGAFASFVGRSAPGAAATLEDAARFSREQVFELARFAQQVDPDVPQRIAGLLTDNPLGMAAFSAAALMLLVRVLARSRIIPSPEGQGASPDPEHQRPGIVDQGQRR